MSSLYSPFLRTTTITFLLTALHLLLSAAFSLALLPQPPISARVQGLLLEDKTRLGSTPPSCHNKCNGCHTCVAVQVPTLPSQDPVQPGFSPMQALDPSATIKYSNYKPLGWKCRCNGHFYNP